MSKSLFNKDWRYTDDALKFDERIERWLQIIFEEYVAMGYSPRELAAIAHGSVSMAEVCCVMDKERLTKDA